MPTPTLKVSAKYPGEYANLFTAEVIAEKEDTFTLKYVMLLYFSPKAYNALSAAGLLKPI